MSIDQIMSWSAFDKDSLEEYLQDSSVIHGIQLFPFLALILVLLGGALGVTLIYSFLRSPPALEFTLMHYGTFFDGNFYTNILIESLKIAITVTIAALVLAYPPAYYLANFDIKYKNILLFLLIIPFWINIIVRTYAWRLILGTNGILNDFLLILGVVQEPMNLLFSEMAIELGLVHVFLPYILIPIYTSLEKLDMDVVSAAKDLGANKVEAFYEITLPRSLPGVASGAILIFILSFGSFVVPQLLGGQRNIMFANLISQSFRVIQNWAFGSTLSVIFVLVIAILIYTFNRFIGLGELYGSDESPANDRQNSILEKYVLANLPMGYFSQIVSITSSKLSFSDQTVSLLLKAYTTGVLSFLYIPVFIVVLFSFTTSSIPVTPIPGLSLEWYAALLDNSALIEATINSLTIASITAVIAGIIGTLAGFGMVRGDFNSRWLQERNLNTIAILPIAVPWIVTGVAVRIFYSIIGIEGTFISVILGHVLITVPFVTLVVASQLYEFDRTTEEAARDLGASNLRTFFEISLPQISAGIIGGMMFAFTISFDNFTQTFFWVSPDFQTLPIQIYSMLRTGLTPEVNAIATIILLISTSIIIFAELSTGYLREE